MKHHDISEVTCEVSDVCHIAMRSQLLSNLSFRCVRLPAMASLDTTRLKGSSKARLWVEKEMTANQRHGTFSSIEDRLPNMSRGFRIDVCEVVWCEEVSCRVSFQVKRPGTTEDAWNVYNHPWNRTPMDLCSRNYIEIRSSQIHHRCMPYVASLCIVMQVALQ